MALSVARLLPGTGLDLTYVDDRALEGSPMRGADNVRVVDGEWWTREGTKALRGVTGGGPFSYIVSLDLMYGNTAYTRHFAIGQAAVIELDGTTFSQTVPYNPSWTGTVSFTNNNTYADLVSTVSGDPAHVDLLYGFDSDGTTQVVYGVSSYSSGSSRFLLAGNYRGPTQNPVSVSGFVTPARISAGGSSLVHRPAFCVFRQQTAYSQGAVWDDGAVTAPLYKEQSPALSAGGIYLVWVNGRTTTPGPILIRLDAVENIKVEVMRKTQSSFTAAVAFVSGSIARSVTTHRTRLIVVRADENNVNDDRTVWYSAPGDLMRWHTGTAGGSPAATHNNIKLTEGQDPITALMPLGSSLIVHRERSQTILTPTGSSSFPPGPFTIDHNHQGLGCLAKTALVNVQGLHIFQSQYGLVQFDGQRCSPLAPGLTRVLAQLGATAEWANDVNHASSLTMVYHSARNELWMTAAENTASDSWQGATGRKVVIYSLTTGELSLQTFNGKLKSLGVLRLPNASEVLVGTIDDSSRYPLVQLTQTAAAYDTASPTNSVTVFDATKVKFPAYVETKWFNFGTETEKEITKIELDLRALSVSSSYQNEVVGDLDTSAFKYMLEIHTDLDLSRFAVQQVVTVTPGDLTGMSGYCEGRRMPPRVIVVPKVRVQGNLFKFRIRNFGAGISVSQPFRISQIQVFYEEREATRREKRP